MTITKKQILVIFLIFLTMSVCGAATRNSYTQYGKHLMPTYYDPYYINSFANCAPSEYVDWTGSYKYVIVGKTQQNTCEYKTLYNPWLRKNKNEWVDYKQCYFNDIQMNELTKALAEHSNLIKSYDLGPYKTTGTKLEYLLYSYEYYGACKYIYKK